MHISHNCINKIIEYSDGPISELPFLHFLRVSALNSRNNGAPANQFWTIKRNSGIKLQIYWGEWGLGLASKRTLPRKQKAEELIPSTQALTLILVSAGEAEIHP